MKRASRLAAGTRRATAVPAGGCPCCPKRPAVTARGALRSHLGADGSLCPGSGQRVGGDGVAPLAPELAAAVDDLLSDATRPKQRDRGRGGRSGNPVNPSCPECGLIPPGRPRADGRPRRHRVRADDPSAPWCVGSPPTT